MEELKRVPEAEKKLRKITTPGYLLRRDLDETIEYLHGYSSKVFDPYFRDPKKRLEGEKVFDRFGVQKFAYPFFKQLGYNRSAVFPDGVAIYFPWDRDSDERQPVVLAIKGQEEKAIDIAQAFADAYGEEDVEVEPYREVKKLMARPIPKDKLPVRVQPVGKKIEPTPEAKIPEVKITEPPKEEKKTVANVPPARLDTGFRPQVIRITYAERGKTPPLPYRFTDNMFVGPMQIPEGPKVASNVGEIRENSGVTINNLFDVSPYSDYHKMCNYRKKSKPKTTE